VINGSNRDQDEFFKDDELIQSIKIGKEEETKWRKIDSKPRVNIFLKYFY
jgi:hypothetical protein